ncbi:hypothetical protein [Microcoleus phage My-WqHQDG]|nr:hypothetical protein [Microcoleus phage My-WqHQDG]
MQNNYDRDMGWAFSTTSKGQTVYSLLANPGTRTPAINASTLAAYSRSAKSIPELLAQRKEKGVDGAEVIDKIISTYNHPSVMGLGHLSVAMEGVDCITSMQFFYNHHLQDGQERSTRFQNFSKGRQYAPCPIEDANGEYCRVLDYWLDGFEYFYPKVEKFLKGVFEVDDTCPALNPRTLDCVRYLVPMGISTSVGAIQNGREWSKYISYLHTNGQVELAQAMELLLKDGWDGYTPEGDVLIKYTEEWDSPIQSLADKVHGGCTTYWDIGTPIDIVNTFQVMRPGDMEYFQGADPLLVHLHLLNHPHCNNGVIHDDAGVAEGLEAYSWKHEMGPIGSSGLVGIHGMADLGTLKDLNRHRSSPAFMPILHSEGNVQVELEQGAYTIHPYLVGTYIGDEMCSYIENGYKMVRAYIHMIDLSCSDKLRNRTIKNLLPHAHVTPYVFYGSASTFMTYICNLRVRPGGHMAYRLLVQAWAQEIASKWLLWSELVPDKPTFSRAEFMDRS